MNKEGGWKTASACVDIDIAIDDKPLTAEKLWEATVGRSEEYAESGADLIRKIVALK